MNKLIWASAVGIFHIASSVAYAQPSVSPQEKAAAHAERKAEGAAAARGPQLGEGDPKPVPRAKVSSSERVNARAERTADGATAAKTPPQAEGDPVPTATPKLSAKERAAGRGAQRAEVRRENKAGEIPSYGESYTLTK